MNILEEIAGNTRRLVENQKQKVPVEYLRSAAYSSKIFGGGKFFETLKKSGLSLICEVKKASPSKGLISPDFPYIEIARNYETSGADCISCLTEPKYFFGSPEIFLEIRANVKIPMLWKDFIIDEYQIYRAKIFGADAILLICALLPEKELQGYLKICDELKIDALVETHDEREIEKALNSGAEIIGVNNRNLKDFSVDFSNAERLRKLIPPGKIYVAESGVKKFEDIELLKKIGADAVLIGETFMRRPELLGRWKG